MNEPSLEGEQQAFIARRLGEYFGETLQTPAQVHGLTRLTGGSSHETWAFDLHLDDQSGQRVVPLVLRRCFESGPLEGRLDVEYALLSQLHALGLPVPGPWGCVGDPSPLDAPFMVVSRAQGTDIRKILAKQQPVIDKAQLGQELVTILARLHAVNCTTALGPLFAAPSGNAALHQVNRWAADIESSTWGRRPLLMAALDRLRTQAPVDGPACLVHGDFKANNLLYCQTLGPIVIDWELAHLGDPLEDLAWTLLWTTEHDLVDGLLSPGEFLKRYEIAAGTTIDSRRLLYWQVFSLVKLAAIFLRGLDTATARQAVRPMLIQLARALPQLEWRLADLLVAGQDQEPTK